MSIKTSNIFGDKERENKFTGNYVKEEKTPSSMFLEPVSVGECPLCGGDVYSENDPSNDHTMARRCCKCTWNDNQFMTWEEMNEMIDGFKGGQTLGEYIKREKEFFGEERDPDILKELHRTILNSSKGPVDKLSMSSKALEDSNKVGSLKDVKMEDCIIPESSEIFKLDKVVSRPKKLGEMEAWCSRPTNPLRVIMGAEQSKPSKYLCVVDEFVTNSNEKCPHPQTTIHPSKDFMDDEIFKIYGEERDSEYVNSILNNKGSVREKPNDLQHEVYRELKSNSRENQFRITSGTNKHGDSFVNLNLTEDFKTFFSQGMLSEVDGDLVIMCNNSTTHFFIVKCNGKELKTVKLSEVVDFDGITFCYNDVTHSLEFNCGNDETNLVGLFRDVLLAFKEEFLAALRYMNTQLELFGNNFTKLVLSEEKEVSLGYTEKLFLDKYSLGKVIVTPCDHSNPRTDIIPRIAYENIWRMKFEYGRNLRVEYHPVDENVNTSNIELRRYSSGLRLLFELEAERKRDKESCDFINDAVNDFNKAVSKGVIPEQIPDDDY